MALRLRHQLSHRINKWCQSIPRKSIQIFLCTVCHTMPSAASQNSTANIPMKSHQERFREQRIPYIIWCTAQFYLMSTTEWPIPLMQCKIIVEASFQMKPPSNQRFVAMGTKQQTLICPSQRRTISVSSNTQKGQAAFFEWQQSLEYLLRFGSKRKLFVSRCAYQYNSSSYPKQRRFPTCAKQVHWMPILPRCCLHPFLEWSLRGDSPVICI